MDSIIISALLTLTVLALVIVIMELVHLYGTADHAFDPGEAIRHQQARAERRIERLMAEAHDAMFHEARKHVDREEL